MTTPAARLSTLFLLATLPLAQARAQDDKGRDGRMQEL
jgi:hypothetical protein